MKEIIQRARRLSSTSLKSRRIGLEREALRVDSDGHLAQTSHPATLGSALTNSLITTDFSEGLLELVTPPLASALEAWRALNDTLRFVHSQIGDELLWPCSMPMSARGR